MGPHGSQDQVQSPQEGVIEFVPQLTLHLSTSSLSQSNSHVVIIRCTLQAPSCVYLSTPLHLSLPRVSLLTQTLPTCGTHLKQVSSSKPFLAPVPPPRGR